METESAKFLLKNDKDSEHFESNSEASFSNQDGSRDVTTGSNRAVERKYEQHLQDEGTTSQSSETRHRVAVIMLLLLGVAFTLFLTRFNFHQNSTPNPGRPVCTLEMFSNDTFAWWACLAVDSLQNNWFPSPIGGLFTYQAWNGFDGFWQNGLVLQTLANYMISTRSTRYKTVLEASLRDVSELAGAYYPQPSCDDMLWFALSYARVYEALNDKRFLERSWEIFEWVWDICWDKTGHCNGGLWFDSSHKYKATITNAQALQLAAKLFRISGNSEFLHRAYQVEAYIVKNRVISSDFLVSDGIDCNSCKPNNVTGYTYNSGVLIGGCVEMYLASNHSEKYLEVAHDIAQRNIDYLSRDGILAESCDDVDACFSNKDARAFKGIFVRNLRQLIDQSSPANGSNYRNFLRRNVQSLLANASCNASRNFYVVCQPVFQDGEPFNSPIGPVFSERWRGPFTTSSPIEHMSALELIIAVVSPSTFCIGPNCNFNPPIPPLDRLTCHPNPCPQHQDCCTWGDQHTCCTPDQQCINGGCY